MKHYLILGSLCLSLSGCANFQATPSSQQLNSSLVTPPSATEMVQSFQSFADHYGYPISEQVIALAVPLQLSQQQIVQSRQIAQERQKFADDLTDKLARKQRVMKHLYATGDINDDSLALLLSEMGILETKLRYVFMSAGFKQRDVLSSTQLTDYHQLRYGNQPQ